MNAERHQWASGAITVKNTFFELVLPEAELLQRSKSAPAPTTDTSVGSDEASEESDEESQQSQCKDGEGQTQGSQSQESVQCEALSTPPESDVDQLQAMGYSIEVVDTLLRCDSVCKELLQTGSHTVIAVDLEGVALSRVGKLCTLQVATRDGRVFIFDVVMLGSEGFKRGLRQVLESESIAKLFWDCRCDADALHHQYSVRMRNVLDMQVLHDASVGGTGEWLRGLEQVLGELLPTEECDRVKDIKKRGKEMYEPRSKGSYEVWKQRPLKEILKAYCAVDVGHLFKMFDTWKDYLDRRTLRQVSERRAEDRVRQPPDAPNKGAQKDFPTYGRAPPGAFFPGGTYSGGWPMAGPRGGGFGGMSWMPHMAMYPPVFGGTTAELEAQYHAGFKAAELRAAQLSEAAELRRRAAQLNQAAELRLQAEQQAMSSVSTTSDEAKISVSTTSPMMGPTQKDAVTKGSKMTPSQPAQQAKSSVSPTSPMMGPTQNDTVTKGSRCLVDSSGAQRIVCTIPESVLMLGIDAYSTFKLEVNGIKLDFMLMLVATTDSCEGPGGFRHSEGNGTLQLKCCSDCSQLPAMSLGFSFFVGDQPKRFVHHDFKLNAIVGLTAETAVWHLQGSVVEGHLDVGIEVEPPLQ